MVRIGLISDTHEADDPLALVEQLRDLRCDYHIHLGDIGGSATATRLVREYKENGRILERLTLAQRAQYDALIQSGTRGVLAWLRVTVGDNPQAAQVRRQETSECYDAVVGAMKSLPNTFFLAGNVEYIVGRGEIARQCVARHEVELITQPRLVSLDGAALILWPATAQAPEVRGLVQLGEELAEQSRGHRPVVLLTHEQVFRGPRPEVYRARVEATGRPPTSIPHYEPNAARSGILRLLRTLPPTVPAGIIHGHIHDSNEVIAAGAPYLRRIDGKGLGLRLYGLGRHRGDIDERGAGKPRLVSTFCVPVGRLAVLTIENGDYRLEMSP